MLPERYLTMSEKSFDGVYRSMDVKDKTYILFIDWGETFDTDNDLGSFIEGFCETMEISDNMCVVTTPRPIESLISGMKSRRADDVRVFEVVREIT